MKESKSQMIRKKIQRGDEPYEADEVSASSSNALLSVKEKNSGFPCWCGAKNYEDAADKCDSSDEGSCCAQYMLEHYLAPEQDR